jgi:hypothetical protein
MLVTAAAIQALASPTVENPDPGASRGVRVATHKATHGNVWIMTSAQARLTFSKSAGVGTFRSHQPDCRQLRCHQSAPRFTAKSVRQRVHGTEKEGSCLREAAGVPGLWSRPTIGSATSFCFNRVGQPLAIAQNTFPSVKISSGQTGRWCMTRPRSCTANQVISMTVMSFAGRSALLLSLIVFSGTGETGISPSFTSAKYCRALRGNSFDP